MAVSKLHKELSIRAVSWMNSRMTKSGMRWATEFQLESGWVADCAILAYPQMRFFDQIKPKPEPTDNLLYIFEAKASRMDFKKCFDKNGLKNRMIGNLHYIVTPKDLIKSEELPEGWGWLMQSGNGLREMVRPNYHLITDYFKYHMGYRMLWTAYGYRSSIEDWELRRGQLF